MTAYKIFMYRGVTSEPAECLLQKSATPQRIHGCRDNFQTKVKIGFIDIVGPQKFK